VLVGNYRNSAKISGRLSAMRKSDFAGPCGCLHPCSQSWMVRELTPSRLANAAWDNFSFSLMTFGEEGSLSVCVLSLFWPL
jgi:hypothetical protein